MKSQLWLNLFQGLLALHQLDLKVTRRRCKGSSTDQCCKAKFAKQFVGPDTKNVNPRAVHVESFAVKYTEGSLSRVHVSSYAASLSMVVFCQDTRATIPKDEDRELKHLMVIQCDRSKIAYVREQPLEFPRLIDGQKTYTTSKGFCISHPNRKAEKKERSLKLLMKKTAIAQAEHYDAPAEEEYTIRGNTRSRCLDTYVTEEDMMPNTIQDGPGLQGARILVMMALSIPFPEQSRHG